ncbi:uncharacterized protein LOC112145380 isoform X2 [Oryzias melastigma]|uniref:uncharacterized protein LOC112145380 isoform X2 n=1 Tax=Oryzias melastigma TaxID=30732 RepID=UPI00168D6A2D|nr:uncharacterized protein LOC112145380 isoform X2 [Oryzias melastigma]
MSVFPENAEAFRSPAENVPEELDGMFGALLLLLLNSRLSAPVPMPEGPQSFPFVQESFPDEHISLENTDPDEEKHIPAENATPRPDKSLTTLCQFPEEPVVASSKEIFEENGGAAPGEAAPPEPNRVTPASASTQEASDLDLEEGEDRFPDVYLEINEGKPEEDLREDSPSEDSLLIPTGTSFVPVDSENESAAEKETLPTEAAMEDDDPGKEIPSTAAASDDIYVAAKRSNQQHRRDFKAAVSSVRGESRPQVNRGAIIGAALITLMSFILIGFVGIKISKKLR